MELSIVMPCLNEVKTLPICIEKAKRFLTTSGIEGEIIVADNGSTDGSIETATAMGARVVPVPIRGYGAALSAGIHSAKGTYVIMGDSDDSYDFLNLQPFVDKLRDGYDLVMGNRFQGGIIKGAMPFMHRFVGNPMLSMLGRRIYDHDVCGDFYCGLRGFRKDAFGRLGVQSTGMEFALEMIIKAHIFCLKITEVPTVLSPDGRDRKPHLRTYRDGWRSLRLYLMMSPLWAFAVPGLTMIVLGAAAFLIAGMFWDGRIQSLVIIGSALIVLGFQAILLGAFAKLVAIEVGLHPPATRLGALQDSGMMEKFLIGGAVTALVGFVTSMVLPGLLQTSSQMQIGVALTTLLTILGGQTLFAGFALGFVHLLTQRRLFQRKRASD
jgi:glycosyltransferase involved in cell wall biosynthesis